MARKDFVGDNPPQYGGGFVKGSVQHDKRSNRPYIKLYIDGKQVCINTDKATNLSFASEKHAIKALGIIQGEIDNGTFNRDDWKKKKSEDFKKLSKPTVKKQSKKWLKGREGRVKTGGLVPRTFKDDKTAVKRIVKYFGNKALDQIIKKDIENFYESLPLSSSSGKYNIVSTLRKMMNDAKEEGLLDSVPEFPKLKKHSSQAKRYMESEIQNRIISCIPDRDQPIFQILRQYGLRPGEARAIHKASIRDGELHIEHSFSENMLRDTTKTGKPRSYMVTPFIQGVLDNLPDNDSKFVCVRSDGKPYTSKDLNKIWREACKSAEIPHFKLYNAMRHSLARNLLEAGYSFDMVAEVLGHSSVEMSRSFYADMPMNKVKDALDNISESNGWVGR